MRRRWIWFPVAVSAAISNQASPGGTLASNRSGLVRRTSGHRTDGIEAAVQATGRVSTFPHRNQDAPPHASPSLTQLRQVKHAQFPPDTGAEGGAEGGVPVQPAPVEPAPGGEAGAPAEPVEPVPETQAAPPVINISGFNGSFLNGTNISTTTSHILYQDTLPPTPTWEVFVILAVAVTMICSPAIWVQLQDKPPPPGGVAVEGEEEGENPKAPLAGAAAPTAAAPAAAAPAAPAAAPAAPPAAPAAAAAPAQ